MTERMFDCARLTLRSLLKTFLTWFIFDEGINLPTKIDINQLKSMNSMNTVLSEFKRGGDVVEELYLSVRICAQLFNCAICDLSIAFRHKGLGVNINEMLHSVRHGNSLHIFFFCFC